MTRANSSSVEAMWNAFVATSPILTPVPDKQYDAWHFCNNQADADALVQLVLDGKKRATCSAHCLYEIEAESPPQVGSYSIVTDWAGEARCVIRIADVQIVPFEQVTAEFAALEGEGDQTLEYWRTVHQKFFEQDLQQHGLTFSNSMLLVCERFDLMYPT